MNGVQSTFSSFFIGSEMTNITRLNAVKSKKVCLKLFLLTETPYLQAL